MSPLQNLRRVPIGFSNASIWAIPSSTHPCLCRWKVTHLPIDLPHIPGLERARVSIRNQHLFKNPSPWMQRDKSDAHPKAHGVALLDQRRQRGLPNPLHDNPPHSPEALRGPMVQAARASPNSAHPLRSRRILPAVAGAITRGPWLPAQTWIHPQEYNSPQYSCGWRQSNLGWHELTTGRGSSSR